jgi:hypothetical protein
VSDEWVPATRGSSAALSFDTADATDEAVRAWVVGDRPVGVGLCIDLGAVECEVVLDAEATADLIDRLDDCRETLDG